MSTAPSARASASGSPRVDGKFLEVDGRRFLVKGVSYGTFAPGPGGNQFPTPGRVHEDVAAIRAAGFNTIRTYTIPSEALLDAATLHGLRLIVGLPWPQHLAFLDDARLVSQIRRDARDTVRRLAGHPSSLLFALGNEIPASVVRWHGHRRVESFLRSLRDEVKAASPDSLLTYVNFPPTEYLDLDAFDVCAFNVYLHAEADLRAYLARLQHIAGPRPLLLAEAGSDSLREGLHGQARITAMHVRAAFTEGACGAVAFAWTDEWWRGGRMVDDWAFGLVDAERRPKPALVAVTHALREAPFPDAERRRWPLVSVVVCAYNAADTIDACLSSLRALTYPAIELIVVDDGSSDATARLAREHPGVQVIAAPHGGLSAARNAGLAAARGEIVAYTDADVRVDPDWLTYLVQPLLHSDLAGVGGPNVVPPHDPWMAHCVARAPGGPTHVLLDDRIAEHVPGCNMAFRREALGEVGGFNPVFLRAGDDVDICWRMQARGWRIGFAPAALVWHHHRASLDAFCRQQVGYGEAEAWLSAHYPDKFAGALMLWHGRIYSGLPFVRALKGRRLNTGMWGTAAFPSVYWVGSPAWQFVPHSAAWMVTATALLAAGLLAYPGAPGPAGWLLASGTVGWLLTLGRSALLASRSDLGGVPRVGRLPPAASRCVYWAVIALLHVLQPLARLRGRLRGVWSLPREAPLAPVTVPPWHVASPSMRHVWESGQLLAGLVGERVFWSETWLAHTSVLAALRDALRASRPTHHVEADDGWHADRDLTVAVGRWGALDARTLVEVHTGGRSLLRIGTRFRFRPGGLVLAMLTTLLAATAVAVTAQGSPALGAALGGAAVLLAARMGWRTVRVVATFHHALTRVSTGASLVPLQVPAEESWRAPVLWRPAVVARALQASVLILVAALGVGRLSSATAPPSREAPVAAPALLDVGLSGGGVAVGLAGDVFVADADPGLIRRLRPRPPAGASVSASDIAAGGDPVLGPAMPIGSASDIAVAPDGDLFVADAREHRVVRITPSSAAVVLVAGTGSAGFAGDGAAAEQAVLHAPGALAVARNGDLYIADTLNDRIRLIDARTGRIRTVAGGSPTSQPGDGGPALQARLSRPMGLAVSPDGDLFIADTGHQRVRRVGARDGRITTIAGDGTAGFSGDGGPAVRARLNGPMGLALSTGAGGTVVYVADSRNDRVRALYRDGTIQTITGPAPVVAPTRLAFHPAGWVYVKDGGVSGVSALAVGGASR